MKYKKGLIFICLIICLFSIASVCATDVNENVVASDGQCDEIITVEDNNDIVTYDNQVNGGNLSADNKKVDEVGATEENELSVTPGTFTDLANDIENAGDELNLTRDYSYFDNDSSYKEGIIINKKIAINGKGFVINGNNQSRVFIIYHDNVILDNITFMNCNSSDSAINWEGDNGILNNSQFINCSTESSEGVIGWRSSNGIINNSIFINCESSVGAVNWMGLNGSINNSRFINCFSYSGLGGAVYWSGLNGQIICSEFLNNTESAVYFSNSNCMLINSKFINCGGNVVVWEGNNGTLIDSQFINCSCYSATYWTGSNGNLTNSAFINCSSTNGFGGAVNWEGNGGIVLKCNFTNCYAKEQGGAIYWVSNNPIISKCIFINNTAKIGNAIYFVGKNGKIINSVINESDIFNITNFEIINNDKENNGQNESNITIGTFTDLANDIENAVNELNLTRNYIYNNETDLNYTNGITINKTIKINGNGFTINGNNHASLLKILANNLVLKNISFCNSHSDNWGSALHWKGINGTLSNCFFINCSDSYGGAIYWTGYCGKIDNCSFMNCYSSSSGGGIYFASKNATISNCNFTRCYAEKNDGGAIFWGGYNGYLFNNNFINCSSSEGGAVLWFGRGGVVSNCMFENCSAATNGGAIYWYYPGGKIYYSNFTGCYAKNGGAIYLYRYNYTVTNSVFINNCATDYGGAIYWDGVNGTITNSKFINNTVQSYSLICTNFTDKLVFIFKSHNNYIDSIYSSSSSLNFTNITYCDGNFVNTDNLTPKCSQLKSGISITVEIYNSNYNLIKNFTQITNDESEIYYNYSELLSGEYIYKARVNNNMFNFNEKNGNFSVPIGEFNCLQNLINDAHENDVINLNHDYTYSLGIDNLTNTILINKNNLTINGNGHIINALQQSNIFEIYSNNVNLVNIKFTNTNQEAIHWLGNDGYLSNCSFVNCSSSEGGAVSWSGSNGSLCNCSFMNCLATYYGGAVHWSGDNGSLNICVFVNCSSNSSSSSAGGSVYWSGVNGSLNKCVFVNCSSSSNYISSSAGGGAVYWSGVNGSLNKCVFVNCSEKGSQGGGAVSWYGVTGTLSNCSFMNCSARGSGGSVYWSGVNGSLNNCSFRNCFASIYGATVYWYGIKGHLSNCNFMNFSKINTSIVNWRGDMGSLFNCSFSDNYLEKAHVIYWNGNDGCLYDCCFVNCSSKIVGSAIYWEVSKNCCLFTSRFINCYSEGSGIVYWYSTDGLLFNCSFMNCSAKSSGGAVCWHIDGNLYNCSFVNCSSNSNGGAVYWIYGKGDLFNCSFMNCSARGSGGAVYWDNNEGSLFNCVFVNCSSGYDGNFIYWYKNGHIYNCSFNGDNYNYGLYCFAYHKVDPSLNIDINNTEIGSAQKILVSIPPLVNNVTISIRNIITGKIIYNQFIQIFDNFEIILHNLTYGDYSCSIVSSSDNWYNSKSNTKNFEVIRKTPNINLTDIKNIIAGDNFTYNVTMDYDANGTIKIIIFNQTFEENVINGMCKINISNIVGGNYNYTVEYSGDSKYNYLVFNKSAKVDYKNSSIDFEIKEIIKFDEYAIINPIVTPKATGTINIFINNIFNKTININETFTLENLNVGNYSITFVYNGDKYYNICSKTKVFNITPINTNISVLYDNLTAGNTIINVTLDSRATGNITIDINNKHYMQSLDNGRTTFIIDELISGGYNYTISYSGDQNFNKNSTTGYFFILLKESKINISAKNIIVGDIAKINYNITKGVTGNISVYINNKFYTNVSIGDEIKLINLTGGKHTIDIIYLSNGFYDSCNDNINLTIFKKSFVKLDVDEINFNESIILNPVLNNGATGKIKIYVDNIYKTQINVGKTYTLSNLKGGNHTIRLAYSGDDYFAPCENTTILKVNKINTTISASPIKAIAGNTVLNIVLNNKASGNIAVNVNNKKYNETLSSGKCTIYIYDLPAGNYEYTIYYNGDQNFNQNTYKNNLNIRSKESSIIISSNNIYVDEIAKINYTLTGGATGILSVYVNNEFVKNVSVGNNIELENLPYGNYTVKVIYNSDGYYATCQNTTTFEVHKLNPTFSFTKNNAIAGDEFVITYILNIDATGTIICNNSTKQLINGRVNFNINNIKGGLHQFNISYSGDDKYNPINKTVNVTIKFKDAIVDFDVKDIIWSDSLTIAPTLTAGATGLLNIYIDNNLNSTIYINGRKDFAFYVGGYHYIKVSYSGDEYYASNSTTKWFNVIKLNSTCDIKGNIETDNSATVYVTLNEDATGEVNIYIKGTKYASDLIEGVATFRVPSLAAGTYDVTIDYEGDTKYASIYTTKSLEVTLKPSTITLNVKNILTGNNLVITPIVTSSASGNLKIYVDNVLKKTIAIGSSYTIENPSIGSHSVRVVYAGDSYHQGNETKTTFRVFTFYPIEVQNSAIIYGMDKHFQAIVYDEYGNVAANKPVAFSINGEDTVVMSDSNGLAVFNKDLPIGTYYVSVINVYVNEEHTYILKVFTSIESENMTRAYNTGMDFKVKLLDENADILSRGYAIFNINNKDYPVVADNDGVAILNANLPVGTYTVTTTNGRTGETKINKITIVPSVEATNMVRGYNSGVDFKAKFLDADAKPLVNQKVAFKIGFTEYESTTDANGFAVLNEQLDVGKYEVTAINKVTGEKATRNLTIVERIVENNDVIRIYGEESYYTIHVVGDDGSFVCENEVVNININNIDYQIRTNNNGYASFRIDENIGSYDILAEYKGYEVYNEVYVLQRVNYIKNLNVSNINYKQNEVVSLDLSSFDNLAYVEFEVDGDNGYKRIFDQSAGNSITLPITNLVAGKYTVTAKYYDLNTHKFSSMAKTFIINKINPKIIIVVEDANVGETATITVNIPDVEGNAEIKVGTALSFNEYLVKNGVIIKEIDSLPAGTYNVDVTYVGDNNYNRFTQSSNLTITQPKTLTKIGASDITITQGKGTTLVATLKDVYGKALVGKGVSIYFNGVNSILTTNNNGEVKLAIKDNLVPKIYDVTIIFVGDEYYVGSTASVKVTVNKIPVPPTPKTTLTLKTVKVKKSAKKLVLQATLKQGKNPLKNKKITFKFNGKKYKAKTNKKGIAKVTIKKKILKKLKVGKNVKYQASYGKITVKKSVKIKK